MMPIVHMPPTPPLARWSHAVASKARALYHALIKNTTKVKSVKIPAEDLSYAYYGDWDGHYANIGKSAARPNISSPLRSPILSPIRQHLAQVYAAECESAELRARPKVARPKVTRPRQPPPPPPRAATTQLSSRASTSASTTSAPSASASRSPSTSASTWASSPTSATPPPPEAPTAGQASARPKAAPTQQRTRPLVSPKPINRGLLGADKLVHPLQTHPLQTHPLQTFTAWSKPVLNLSTLSLPARPLGAQDRLYRVHLSMPELRLIAADRARRSFLPSAQTP
jgi:hypothetical protein